MSRVAARSTVFSGRIAGLMMGAPRPKRIPHAPQGPARHVLAAAIPTVARAGVDLQENALHAGDLDAAAEAEGYRPRLRTEREGGIVESTRDTVRGTWDAYSANVADHLERGVPLVVTAEQAREVVRLLEAAVRSSRDHAVVGGPWGVL